MRYETFYKRYQPEMDATGESLKQYDFSDPLVTGTGLDQHFIWTMVDVDGTMYIVPGWHRVNRMYYIRTAKPWTDKDSNIEVRY
jgi:hypothetical protein